MKTCPNCQKTYDDDANFCPEESCATPDGPRRLESKVATRFSLGAELGGHRTGQVFRAVDGQTGGNVAYKTVAGELGANPATFARIEREFKQLLRISSPNIVGVLDVGKTPAGQLYVAMELCEGETLADLLRKGPVSLDRAKQIVSQIGQGLLEAQKAGLVHRDLAPKNVLMSASGEAKLINFPIAVPIDDRLSGVAEYGSPEQGQGKPVDQRSNTYSLACIFYHLVTGEPPFQGADPAAVFALHASSPALAPSQRRPAANLPSEADKAVLKALDKNSSRRHLTLRLFLNEIEALQAVAAAAPAPAAGGRDVGFAKTMLFAGGQNEIQDMVQKAIAARQAPAAATAAPVAAAQPSVAATIAATPSPVAAASRLTPPPVTPHPGSAMAAEMDPVAAARQKAAAASSQPAPAPAGAKGNAFRETLWFKKGDVEQMVADAKAKAAATGQDASAVAAPDEDVRPIEDRYRDDGTLTTDDRKKFSLRTGATATGLPVARGGIDGEKMSAAEMMGEMGGGKKTGVYIGIAVVVVAALVGILMALNGGGGEKEKHGEKAAAVEPAAVAKPTPPPAPPAPAPAPAPVVAKPAEPAVAAVEKKTEPVAKKPAARKAAKKKRSTSVAKKK